MFKTKACLVVEVAVIRTAATEILIPIASHEFEILVNLRVAVGSGADIFYSLARLLICRFSRAASL